MCAFLAHATVHRFIDPAGLHPHRSEIVPSATFASSCGGRCPNLGREAYPMCLRNSEQKMLRGSVFGRTFQGQTNSSFLMFLGSTERCANLTFNISMCRKNKLPTGPDRQHQNQHHLFCSGHPKLLRQFLR